MASLRSTAYRPVRRLTLESWSAHKPIAPVGQLGQWGSPLVVTPRPGHSASSGSSEAYCQAADGGAGWTYGRTARYLDVAHVLYPGGAAPVPVEDAPAPEAEGPVQLALFEHLATT